MAGSHKRQEKINGLHCTMLVLDGGGYFARQLLLQETVNNGLDAFLAANKVIIGKNRIMPASWYSVMFPPNGDPTDLERWELSLVNLILLLCVPLNKAQQNAVKEVGNLKNVYVAHRVQMSMTESEFQVTWADISSTLKRVSVFLTDPRCQTVIADMITSTENERLSSDTTMETTMEGSSKEREATEMVTIDEKLSFKHAELLGKGAKSIVYKGHFEGIPVAVKQIECIDKTDAEQTEKDIINIFREKEIMSKIERERNENIVGFYYSKVKDKYLYLALELCKGTLANYVESENIQLQQSFPPLRVVNAMAGGLQYLHSQKVVHRDLKPENVMYISKGEQIERFVLGDFGTSKCTTSDMFSVSGPCGTLGYIPYEMCEVLEQLEEHELIKSRLNIKSDIFALGCLIYFTYTFGKHPFGTQFGRQDMIRRGELPTLNNMKEYLHPCKVLLETMLSHSPQQRPTVTEIMSHPALWSHKKIMNFFHYSSDIVENMYKRNHISIGMLDEATVIKDGDWIRSLPEKLKRNCENRNQYTTRRKKVAGLLRAIRNTEQHLSEYEEDVQKEVGHTSEKQAELWMTLQPELLMHVHSFITGNVPSVPEEYQIQVAPPSEEIQDRESVPASTSPVPFTSKETSRDQMN